ncbi:MAG: YdcF family protein [Bacteroidota bacterium]
MKEGIAGNILKKAWRILRGILVVAGTFALLSVILAFTPAPFWIWYGMGVKMAGIHRQPDYIVVLGGGGMPSESGLMRCWFGAKAAARFPKAGIIVALPGDRNDSLSSVNLMKQELVIRGIAPERILLEDSGTNTRAEALNVMKMLQKQSSPVAFSTFHFSILIVTSPEHLLRSVLTFRKAGFLNVDGLPAFEKTVEVDLGFVGSKLGGRKWMVEVGQNINIRYQFWIQMKYEFLVLRESIALMYYKLQGWA